MLPGIDTQMWLDREVIRPEDELDDSDHNLYVVAGVIQQAIKDLDDCSMTEVHEQRQAYWWLFLDHRDANHPFSLAWCCDMIRYSPRKVREKALQAYPRKCASLQELFARVRSREVAV
jgi:hypothetical protein